MTTKKIMSIGLLLALAGMFFSSGNSLTPLFAQSNNDDEEQKYKDFAACLAEEEGTKGYASEQQIRDCFAPLYNTGSTSSGDSDSSTGSTSSGDSDSSTGSTARDNSDDNRNTGTTRSTS
jgi:hypothetical protein